MSSSQRPAENKTEALRMPALSVEEQIELRRLTSHRDGLDCMASLIRSGQSDPSYRIIPKLRRQIQARFRELVSAGFKTAESEIDEVPNNVLLQIHTVRWSIQAKIDPLAVRSAIAEVADLPLKTHNERVLKFEGIARSHGKIEAAAKEILDVSRSTWYLYKRLQSGGTRRLDPDTKTKIDKIIDDLKSPY